MIQRILHARHFLACLLAGATGMVLFFRAPFPEDNFFLRVMAMRSDPAFLFFKYSYTLFLYTTPYIAYSILLSGFYIFALKAGRKIRAGQLPPYSDPRTRTQLTLVLGEVHNPRKQTPSETPSWLIIPERGLFTGIAIVGAVGSGKTASCMYPFAEQILAYRAADVDRRIGGLILEVKGDFCGKVQEILARYGRASDYVEIGLESEYRYNPLHNDLDAYALAYNIASLLNNLFGRGKEPFWQQAYTNLVKFIILLHKVAFDYVTLFDVYECAINPDLLESRIKEAERRLIEADSVLLWEEEYLKHPRDLDPFAFRLDKESNRYRAPLTPGLVAVLKITMCSGRRKMPLAGIPFRLKRKHSSKPSKDGSSTIGDASSPNCGPPSLREFPYFSRSLMTISTSSARFVPLRSATTPRPMRISGLVDRCPLFPGSLNAGISAV